MEYNRVNETEINENSGSHQFVLMHGVTWHGMGWHETVRCGIGCYVIGQVGQDEVR